jgi:hypothetical protein
MMATTTLVARHNAIGMHTTISDDFTTRWITAGLALLNAFLISVDLALFIH